MSKMFSNCQELNNLEISNFETNQVEDMSEMFKYCKSLIYLDLSNFDTSLVTDISSMFQNCIKLREIIYKHLIMNYGKYSKI